MKIAIVLIVGLSMVLMISAAPEYTSKYDNVDLDQILASDRLLNNHFKCLMERGTCTTEGRELKEVLPDAIKTECGSCNEKQKKSAKKVIRFLMKNKPSMWAELVGKYDPEGLHKDNYPTEDSSEEAGASASAETTA